MNDLGDTQNPDSPKVVGSQTPSSSVADQIQPSAPVIQQAPPVQDINIQPASQTVPDQIPSPAPLTSDLQSPVASAGTINVADNPLAQNTGEKTTLPEAPLSASPAPVFSEPVASAVNNQVPSAPKTPEVVIPEEVK